MNDLHLPWLEISVLVPLVGAAWTSRLRDFDLGRKWCLFFTGVALACTTAASLDFHFFSGGPADGGLSSTTLLPGREVFAIDQLSSPLLPLIALLYCLTAIATVRAKIRQFSFAWTLLSEALALAAYSCREPWILIGLLAAGTVPPYLELRARGKPTRVYVLHMALYVGLMVVGWTFVAYEGGRQLHSWRAIVPLIGAILIRNGIAPFHCWMTDLFEHATFGTALSFVTPMAGAYAAVRLVLPIAPDWVLRSIGLMSLITAVYAAGMALVQAEARRFFCYLFLSHSALVLVGLEVVTPLGLTGALCVWLSISLALSGFGLTLRALEARRGRLSLAEFHGLFRYTPYLAMCFLLTGLASVGFPGTFGFVGTEMLVDGAVEAYPYIGIAVVAAAAINGIAVVQTYFRLFTGTRHFSSLSLQSRNRERFAVLTLATLILLGGLIPQPVVVSRNRAAEELLHQRKALSHVAGSHTDGEAERVASQQGHGGGRNRQLPHRQ
jgi:NADH-quinone oxidoreductase subunit M